MRVGDTLNAAVATAVFTANARPAASSPPAVAGGAAQAADARFGEAVVIPADVWERFEKAKASIAEMQATGLATSEPETGAFRPKRMGLSVTGGGFGSANVAGTTDPDSNRNASVSLRLGGVGGVVRLDGEVSGAAEVGLHVDASGGPADASAILRVRTGEGRDAVSLFLDGDGGKHIALHTNGGDDTVIVSGAERASISVDAGEGDDAIRIAGNGSLQHLSGGAGNDEIELLNGRGLLGGGAGDDRINLSSDVAAAASKSRAVSLRGVRPDGSQVTLEKVLTQDAPTVVFGRGDGHDVVTTTTQAGAGASVQGRAGIAMHNLQSSDVEAVREGADLVLRVRDTGESLKLIDYDPAAWGLVEFLDGVAAVSDLAASAARLNVAA